MVRSLLLLSLLLISEFLISGPWVQKPSLPGPARHRAFSFVISDKAYVGGGWNGWVMFSDFWEFDAASNSWTQRANTPANFYTSSAVGIGAKGYVTGGTAGAALYEYDPATNTWTTKASAPQGAFWESSAVNINNKLYVSDWSVIMVYDPTTNSWTSNTPTPSLNIYGCGVNIGNYMYTFFEGGMNTLRYDPGTNTLTQLAACPGESRSQASAFAAGGKAYAGCGDGFINDNINDFWEYDPLLNSWRRIDDLPGDTRENATTFTLNGRGYICTGTNGINHQDLWMLIPENITSVEELNSLEVSVYPNPSSHEVHFNLQSAAGDEILELYSSSGALLRKVELKEINGVLLRNDLPAGTYFYKIVSGKKSIAGKVIFQ